MNSIDFPCYKNIFTYILHVLVEVKYTVSTFFILTYLIMQIILFGLRLTTAISVC